MRVFIITDGDCSFYSIKEVFTDRETADLYVSKYGGQVEEFSTDLHNKKDLSEGKLRYYVTSYVSSEKLANSVQPPIDDRGMCAYIQVKETDTSLPAELVIYYGMVCVKVTALNMEGAVELAKKEMGKVDLLKLVLDARREYEKKMAEEKDIFTKIRRIK